MRREASPLLRCSYGEAAGRTLLGAVAEIVLDVGWMAYDAAKQGLARRCMVQALRLSHAAGERLFGGRVLAAMSHQGLFLGDVPLALDLTRAARAGTAGLATPTVTAMLAAMEACAHAALGATSLCMHALDDAEHALAESDPGGDPDWVDFDEGGLRGHAARALGDLGRAHDAEWHATRSIELCRTDHKRTRVQRYVILAAAQLHNGKPADACATGSSAVEEMRGLRSVRAHDDVARLMRLLASRDEPEARGFVEQARHVLGTTAPPRWQPGGSADLHDLERLGQPTGR